MTNLTEAKDNYEKAQKNCRQNSKDYDLQNETSEKYPKNKKSPRSHRRSAVRKSPNNRSPKLRRISEAASPTGVTPDGSLAPPSPQSAVDESDETDSFDSSPNGDIETEVETVPIPYVDTVVENGQLDYTVDEGPLPPLPNNINRKVSEPVRKLDKMHFLQAQHDKCKSVDAVYL